MLERLYRVLLRLLPREIRDPFGPEMLDTARALDADPRRGPSRTLRAIADTLVTPISLRADLRDERWLGASRSRSVRIDGRVAMFAAGLTILPDILFGLGPRCV